MNNVQILLLILIGLTILFIHGQSLNVGEKSSQISAKVLTLVVNLIRPLKDKRVRGEAGEQGVSEAFIREKYNSLHHVIRKIAHATEFAVLGGLLLLFLKLDGSTTLIADIGLSMGIVFVVGSIDETIQRFVPGRSCRFTDVLIDFGGGVIGIFAALVVSSFFNK